MTFNQQVMDIVYYNPSRLGLIKYIYGEERNTLLKRMQQYNELVFINTCIEFYKPMPSGYKIALGYGNKDDDFITIDFDCMVKPDIMFNLFMLNNEDYSRVENELQIPYMSCDIIKIFELPEIVLNKPFIYYFLTRLMKGGKIIFMNFTKENNLRGTKLKETVKYICGVSKIKITTDFYHGDEFYVEIV